MYCLTFQCDTYERLRKILYNMDEIAKKREDAEKKDRRGKYMKELHRRTKEFHETHCLIQYKECLSIVANQMKVEKQHDDVQHIVDEMVLDFSNSTIDE